MSINRQLVVRRGNMLAAGPRTIHVSGSVGNSYVESSTSLLLKCATHSTFRSCRIYCDACGSDESGYLLPLARIAEWDRASDMKIPNLEWPNINIRLLEIDLDCPILQSEIEILQKRIDSKMLTSYGLPTRRNFGDVELGSNGSISIETNAGWQVVSREIWLGDSPDFLNTFNSLTDTADDIGTPVDKSQWVERYEYDPEMLASGAGWEWDYKPR